MPTLVFSSVLIAFLLVCIVPDDSALGAGPGSRPIQIGALTSSWGPTPPMVGIRDGLLEMGYKENDDFVIGVRFTQGDLAALPTAARELVEHGADIIFAVEDAAVKAAQRATVQVPIVFAAVSNPVELGVVQSFGRPGGNITGVSDLGRDLIPKRLELFQATVPTLRRLLLPYDAASQLTAAEVVTARQAARRFGIELIEHAIRSQAEASTVLARSRQDDVDGILVLRCCAFNIPGFVQETTAKQKIPAIFDSPFWVERGALVSYGADYYTSGKLAARQVDKIIKGASPADVPVEVNSKIEFVINLKTAKALGLTIPPTILFQATRVIQ